jgi:hypothetical protein
MKQTLLISCLGLGLGLAALQSAEAQQIKTNNTYGNTFTVSQSDIPVTGNTYNTSFVQGTSSTDTLQTLLQAGYATISYSAASPQTSLADGSLTGFADANASGGADKAEFNTTGANSPTNNSNRAPNIINFVFSDPNAPNGETLTNLSLFTLQTGDGKNYYDVDIAYSTDGVNFTKFLTAEDMDGDVNGYEVLAASGFNGAISGVKALQLTGRSIDAAPGNNYQEGTYISEFDVNATPTAAAPEPSQFAAFGLGILGLAGLVFKARKRIAVS